MSLGLLLSPWLSFVAGGFVLPTHGGRTCANVRSEEWREVLKLGAPGAGFAFCPFTTLPLYYSPSSWGDAKERVWGGSLGFGRLTK